MRVESSIRIEILSDQKPFTCKICNKSFITKRAKIKHLKRSISLK